MRKDFPSRILAKSRKLLSRKNFKNVYHVYYLKFDKQITQNSIAASRPTIFQNITKSEISLLILKYEYLHFSFFIFQKKIVVKDQTGPIHYITSKAFAMASGNGTKCETCFWGSRMILHAQCKNTFPK